MSTNLIEMFQNYLKVSHVIPAARGSLGIYAALRAWDSSGKIAVPSSVCQDVISAILMAGWTPLFCDVDPNTGLTLQTEWVRAKNDGADGAIVVHLYGNAADTELARTIFPNGLIIDDAAQALGARLTLNSCLAGTYGNIGLISFGKSKQIEVGAAILLTNYSDYAKACASELASVVSASEKEIYQAEINFRSRFEKARLNLQVNNEINNFAGLLNGYSNVLRVSWQSEWSELICKKFEVYDQQLEMRHRKVNYWLNGIEGTGLIPMYFGSESAPWRFACRLPGCNWKKQHRIGEALREKGLDVSHWYMPSHWYLPGNFQQLPGSVKLAQESFQFWIDDKITLQAIKNSKQILNKVFHDLQELI
jgi:dTDP-4-amino-4,6-dideoxygalactose transaminase